MDEDPTVLAGSEPQPPAGELRAGSVVNRRFVVERVLGRGGMGVVYRSRDLRKEEAGDRNPYVALKVLSDQFRRDPRMAIALQREARKAQSLAHPNIATVYDFDRDATIVYLTMEELDGQPLDALIRSHPEGMKRSEALTIIRGLCLGLAYAHNKNIIHSDFKPGNVFVTASGQTKILDFGIARAAPAEHLDASETTRFDAGDLGALTPSYAACEMFEGEDPHPADDVYALAIVAYQLLSGQHPFGRQPATRARDKGLEPKPLRGLKRREWRAIRRGLAFDRAARSQHAAEFLRDFEGAPRLKMVAGVAIVLGAAFAAYAGYVQVRELARAAPEIEFERLPMETRAEIIRLLREGAIFRRFGDAASALSLYRDAYELHPRNEDVVAALDDLLTELTERAIQRGNAGDLQRLAENLDTVMATDEFLGRHASLRDARARVGAALARSP